MPNTNKKNVNSRITDYSNSKLYGQPTSLKLINKLMKTPIIHTISDKMRQHDNNTTKVT